MADETRYATPVGIPADLFDTAVANGPFISEKTMWLYGRLCKESKNDLKIAAVIALLTHHMLLEYARNEHRPAEEVEAEIQQAKLEKVNRQFALEDQLADLMTDLDRDRVETLAKAMYGRYREIKGAGFFEWDASECYEETRQQYRWAAAIALAEMAGVL